MALNSSVSLLLPNRVKKMKKMKKKMESKEDGKNTR